MRGADAHGLAGKWAVVAAWSGAIMAGMDSLRVVFMGTPGFVTPVAEAVVERGCDVIAAYTAPDRRVGRGLRTQPSPVKEWAEAKGIPVFMPEKLGTAEERERFVGLGADLVVLAAYGLFLPKTFLFTPRYGAVNIHPSLLPRHRGAAPVAAAILAGDSVTGTSVMVMGEGMDNGPVLAQREVALTGTERTPVLTEALFSLGADLLRECLPAYVGGELKPQPQPEEGVTVVKRFAKEDGVLDWTRPAEELERQVRAFDPWPGSYTTWNGKRLEVLDAEVRQQDSFDAPVGAVVPADDRAAVVTGEGLLVLRRVKIEGRPAAGIQEFLRGRG
ncbi:MAG: methionyl-tRNA formyltransferase, partial [Dehalococcoidia bacterium]